MSKLWQFSFCCFCCLGGGYSGSSLEISGPNIRLASICPEPKSLAEFLPPEKLGAEIPVQVWKFPVQISGRQRIYFVGTYKRPPSSPKNKVSPKHVFPSLPHHLGPWKACLPLNPSHDSCISLRESERRSRSTFPPIHLPSK